MRKPILAVTLVALFSCPTLASFAGESSGHSEQETQGTSQAESSSSVSNSRLYEEQPPLSKEAQAAEEAGASSGSGSSHASGGTGTARSAPSVASYAAQPQGQVQTYAWTK